LKGGFLEYPQDCGTRLTIAQLTLTLSCDIGVCPYVHLCWFVLVWRCSTLAYMSLNSKQAEDEQMQNMARTQKRLQDLCRSLQKDRDAAYAELAALKGTVRVTHPPGGGGGGGGG